MNINDKVYVAGHNGMVGSALIRVLKNKGFNNILFKSHKDLDLVDEMEVKNFFSKEKPDIVIIAAARVGGIQANIDNPSEFLFENLCIQNNIIHQCYVHKIKKVCFLGSSCIYPKESPQPIKEDYLLTGKLESTNESYAIAKIAGIKMIESYNKQYDLNGISVMPCNLYGTNDNFDPVNSHVLSSLVKKFVDAADQSLPEVTVWGSGVARREFMHVNDAAEAIIFLLENYNESEIINVGVGKDISIKELAELVAKKADYSGKIKWDLTKPDGTLKKCLDTTKLEKLGYKVKIDLSQGIEKTIMEYKMKKDDLDTIPLMKNTFISELETKKRLSDFIMSSTYLSMGKQCGLFENEFAEFQGTKHAVLFNSGGSANLAIIQTLKNLGHLKDGDKVGFSGLTWSTNVMPIIQLGLVPVPIDCSTLTLNVMSSDLKLCLKNHDIKAFFATNVLGFSGDLDNIKQICKENKIIFLEDNCEALGSEINKLKTGTYGEMNSCSFFVAHHMSTIEGGMVCTDSDEYAEMLKIVRANGWDRNLTIEQQNKWRKEHNVSSEFFAKYTFYDLGFNLRPTEITGFLGRMQLKFLSANIQKREKNYLQLEKIVKENDDLVNLDRRHLNLLSNFSFPVVCINKQKRDIYYNRFVSAGVEIRPMIAGNIQEQPFFRKYSTNEDPLPGVSILHENSFYCGNYPELTDDNLKTISHCLSN
jgi:CDP-4-dehydro-6-deoxyglucose reductase, E1